MYVLELMAIVAYMLYGVCLLPIGIFKRDFVAIKGIIILLVFQNIVAIFAADLFGDKLCQIVILLKDIILYGGVVVGVFNKLTKKISHFFVLIVLVCVMLLGYVFVSSCDLYTKLVCYREIMTPIILLMYGILSNIKQRKLMSLIRFVVQVGLVYTMLSLIEYFILGDQFWLMVHIEKYMSSKGFSSYLVAGNGTIPGNFYTFDYYDFIGISVRRCVGFMADPLMTSHFIALCAVVVLFCNPFKNKTSRFLSEILFLAALILTFSKGGWLIFGIACLFKLYKKSKMVGSLIAIGVMFGVAYIIKSNVLQTVEIHMSGFMYSIENLTVLGNGIGTAGNYANLYGASAIASESYIAAILGQIGIVGLFLFLSPFFFLFIKVNKNSRNTAVYYKVFPFLIYIAAVFVEACASESSISYTGSGTSFIVLGVLYNIFVEAKHIKLYKKHDINNLRKLTVGNIYISN